MKDDKTKSPTNGVIVYSEDSTKGIDSNSRQIHQSEQKIDLRKQVNQDSVRKNIMQECLEALHYVANLSGVAEARSTYVFLKDHLVLAKVHEDSVIFLGPYSDASIAFVVILKDDTLGLNWMKYEMDHQGISHQTKKQHCIVAEASELGGKTGNGLLMLFYGIKANVSDFRKYDPVFSKDSETFDITNIQWAHTVLNDVLMSLGNDQYDSLLQKEIVRMEKTYYEDNTFSFKPIDTMVFAIFGAVTTPETTFVKKAFWSNAAFTMLDKDTSSIGEYKMFKKQSVIESIYWNLKK